MDFRCRERQAHHCAKEDIENVCCRTGAEPEDEGYEASIADTEDLHGVRELDDFEEAYPGTEWRSGMNELGDLRYELEEAAVEEPEADMLDYVTSGDGTAGCTDGIGAVALAARTSAVACGGLSRRYWVLRLGGVSDRSLRLDDGGGIGGVFGGATSTRARFSYWPLERALDD
eukprot:s573_g12.t1